MTCVSSVREAGHPKPVLWDNLEGRGGEGGERGFRIRGTHVYLWLIHVDVWQKPSQYCNYPIKFDRYYQLKWKLCMNFLKIKQQMQHAK